MASSSFEYDDAFRLRGITHAQDASLLAEYRWQYDEANRVSAFSCRSDGTAFYTYDDRGQLTGEFYADQYLDAAGDFQAVATGGYNLSLQPIVPARGYQRQIMLASKPTSSNSTSVSANTPASEPSMNSIP